MRTLEKPSIAQSSSLIALSVALALLLAGCHYGSGRSPLRNPDAATPLEALLTTLDAQSYIDSHLIMKNGRVTVERHSHGYEPDDPHQLTSIAKVIMSALVGIALDRGLFRDVDQPLRELLPDHFAEDATGDKGEVTVRHLLTMTQGFARSDGIRTYLNWRFSGDRAAHTLGQPVVHPPGEEFLYCNGSPHLLSVALTRASGMSTRDFAQKFLFNPIGVRVAKWASDGKGYHIGGGEMEMTPRDLALFGRLYLNGGRHEGTQVIPESWVKESTRKGSKPPKLWGEYDYGYYWWLREVEGTRVLVGSGWAGNSLFVVPSQDLVIVVLTRNTWSKSSSKKRERIITDAVDRYVISLAAQGGRETP